MATVHFTLNGNPVSVEADGARTMANGCLVVPPPAAKGDAIAVDIPTDFQELKRLDPAAARDVRMRTRDEFEDAFARGYVVTAFTALTGRAYYTLTKVG